MFICTHTNADASRGLVVFKTHYVRDISETKKEHCNNMNEIHHNIPEKTFGNPHIWYLLLILIRNKGNFFFIFKTIHLTVYAITNRCLFHLSTNEPMPMPPFCIGSLKQHRACGVVPFKRIQIQRYNANAYDVVLLNKCKCKYKYKCK